MGMSMTLAVGDGGGGMMFRKCALIYISSTLVGIISIGILCNFTLGIRFFTCCCVGVGGT